MEKKPVSQVRKATGMTQEKFSKTLGISRAYLAKVETGKKPFTPELQKKIASVTGAWIKIDKKGNPKPAVPVRGTMNTAIHQGESAIEHYLEKETEYANEHWEKWHGHLYSNPTLRFSGKEEELLFWLMLLLAGSYRAKKAESVGVEVIHALDQIAVKHNLIPAIEGILKEYSPIFPAHETRHGFRIQKAAWKPYSRPPTWLRAAIDLVPLSSHVDTPGIDKGDWGEKLKTAFDERRKTFIALLEKDPDKALQWAKKEGLNHRIQGIAETEIAIRKQE